MEKKEKTILVRTFWFQTRSILGGKKLSIHEWSGNGEVMADPTDGVERGRMFLFIKYGNQEE